MRVLHMKVTDESCRTAGVMQLEWAPDMPGAHSFEYRSHLIGWFRNDTAGHSTVNGKSAMILALFIARVIWR